MPAEIALSDKDKLSLDNPVWTALTGPHAQFARTVPGRAYRYRAEIGPFAAIADDSPGSWQALARLSEPDDRMVVVGRLDAPLPEPPADWKVLLELRGYQLVAPPMSPEVSPGVLPAPDETISVLTAADVPEMLALVELTQPGPFGPQTIELGGYLGVRQNGKLVAMAGRRFAVPGWTEISAVCTHPDYRGQGLSRRLINAVLGRLALEGRRGFLHVTHQNTGADALYRSMGFQLRTDVRFSVLRYLGIAS